MFWVLFLGIVAGIFLIQWYLFRTPDGEPFVGNLDLPIDENLAGTAMSNSHFTRYASAFRTGDDAYVLESLVLKVRCVAGLSVTLRVLLYESGEDGPEGPNLIEKWPVGTWSGRQFGDIAFLRAANQKFELRPNTKYWVAFYNNNTAGDTSAEWARTSVSGADEGGKPGASIAPEANFQVSGSRGSKWVPGDSGSPGMFRIFVRPLPGGASTAGVRRGG